MGTGGFQFADQTSVFPTGSSRKLAEARSWWTAWVAFRKSSGRAQAICSTKVCGLRSQTGNHELCTCTMMRWPGRNVWFTWGMRTR